MQSAAEAVESTTSDNIAEQQKRIARQKELISELEEVGPTVLVGQARQMLQEMLDMQLRMGEHHAAAGQRNAEVPQWNFGATVDVG